MGQWYGGKRNKASGEGAVSGQKKSCLLKADPITDR
jgi:hypothetical protein